MRQASLPKYLNTVFDCGNYVFVAQTSVLGEAPVVAVEARIQLELRLCAGERSLE